MYTQTQLEAIKIFGKKELSFGCLVSLKEEFKSRYFSIEITDILSVVHIDSKYENLFKAPRIRGVLELPNQMKHELNILGHEPHLFPDVASVLQSKGYVLELVKINTIDSVIKITRWDIKKAIKIPYKKLIPFLYQEESTLTKLINLFK